MSITADSLQQAREALIAFSQQKISLLSQIREQGKKIVDLEREVQKQATAASTAREALASAKIEIEALRSLVPSDETQRAFDDLVQFLSAPAETHPEMRIAA
jgi:chromosome segregation ATPase